MGREEGVAIYAVGGEEEIHGRKERLPVEKEAMEGSQSSSSSYTSRTIVFCHCGTKSLLRTSWTTANPGRRFFGCGMYEVNGGCGYFRWHDPPSNARDKDIINRLLQRNKKFEGQMLSYKRRATWAVWCMLACWIAILFYVISSLIEMY